MIVEITDSLHENVYVGWLNTQSERSENQRIGRC